MITLIIPLRLSEHPIYNEIERLERIAKSVPSHEFSIMIVDYGTGIKRQSDLEYFSKKHPEIEIIKGGSPDVPFSIGEARDIGVCAAKTPIIMFNDLDFICETETYCEIAKEVRYRNLASQGYTFMCIPTIFLTEVGTKKYLSLLDSSEEKSADRFAHNEALYSSKDINIEHYALGSSALVINRHFYLSSGGHDRSFTGHGAEDFEYYNRLTNLAPCAGRPPHYNKNIPFREGKWEGFRAFFSLYGMNMWMRGICLVHLYHPRRENVDTTYKKSSQNFRILTDRLNSFNATNGHLPPIPDTHVGEKTLVLTAPNSRAAESLRMALPALGQYNLIEEKAFGDARQLINYVKRHNYSRILFLNPYGNSHRLSLYNFARDNGVICISFDRGALNDSWFFDDSGFLGNSTSYNEEKWNRPLSSTQQQEIREWTNAYIEKGNTLEKNGHRQSADEWRRKLGIGNKKVILIALQRPNDTATRFFSGPSTTYQNFLRWVQVLCENIDRSEYQVLIKKHPLETENLSFSNAISVPDTAHIHDLINLCDKVIVLNSGVGVLSLLMQKPVIVCGNAFYSSGGLAYQANNENDLIELASNNLTLDAEKAERFIYYLKSKFYSFGKSSYKDSIDENGNNIRLCYQIKFSVIRGLKDDDVLLGDAPQWIPPASFIFRGVTSSTREVSPSLARKQDKSIKRPSAPPPYKVISRSVLKKYSLENL